MAAVLCCCSIYSPLGPSNIRCWSVPWPLLKTADTYLVSHLLIFIKIFILLKNNATKLSQLINV